MKPSLIFIAIIGSVIAAPAEDTSDIDVLRTKKSPSYGPQSYGPAPCAASHVPYSPVALYLGPQPALAPQYKEDEHNKEEVKESARSYEAPIVAPGYSSGGGYGLGPASIAGPAVGLFPHARVGGCNVPLLLSCSPSVVAGHLAETHAYGGHGYGAPAYKNVEDKEEPKREARDIDLSERAASHHKVSEDYPDPNQGNHHLISQDYPQPNLTRVTIVKPERELAKEQPEKKL